DTVFDIQPPDTLLIQKIFTAQRTHGTQIDDIARKFVVARFAGENVDFFTTAAMNDLQLGRPADFASEPHAAGAHDAAVGEKSYLIADVVFIGLDVFGFLQPTISATVMIAVILQAAFSRLIADRT